MNLKIACDHHLKRRSIIKTFLIMKLAAVILFGTCLQVNANGLGQKVTLLAKNVSLQEIFKEINHQTGYKFFYEDELLNQAPRIDVKVKDAPIEKY